MPDAPKAWLTRSGKYGERDEFALTEGVTPGGYGEVGDLTDATTRDEVFGVVEASLPDNPTNRNRSLAAQLWTLRGRMSVGDLVVLPLKESSQLAIGTITGDYEYRADEPDPAKRHVRPVEWLVTDLPRSKAKQDLLYSLGAFSTYCGVSRHNAAERIQALANGKPDPGWADAPTVTKPRTPPSSPPADEEDEEEINLANAASIQIERMVLQEFAGHAMQELVAAILRAQGYTCWVAPDGADGGTDIRAGKGPMGMDDPLVVQVKSQESTVGAPEVQQLLGNMASHSASGLLVAWGGVKNPAKKLINDHYFSLRLWDSTAVLDLLTRHYEELPENIRAQLPLQQIWIPVGGE